MAKKDARGLAVFTKFADERGCEVTVQESSTAGGRRAWLFLRGGASNGDVVSRRAASAAPIMAAHLSPQEARRIARALLRWADG